MVLYNTPCLASFLLIDQNQRAINVYFVYVAWRLSGVERLNHPFLEFKETINFLTDQIERKGRKVSPYGIPQDAFCFSIET